MPITPSKHPLPACLLLATLFSLAACGPDTPTGNADAPTVASPTEAVTKTADPKAEVLASMDRFLSARSFHASMRMEGAQNMTSEMDFVAPDRYRIIMPIGTQVIVGDTMYIDVQGRHSKEPLPEGSVSQWRDPLKTDADKTNIRVEALGEDLVDGRPARKYGVSRTEPAPSELTYWIGQDDLPLRIVNSGQSQGKPYTVTIDYSRFDDPRIAIEVPQ